jgi:ParB family transcriptional regulator, chromosome partitioning protein
MNNKNGHTMTTHVSNEKELAGASVVYKELSLDLIDDPAAPMRQDLSPANVEELILSIRQVGLIEPIVVKPVNGRYEVIAGHRRTFASRLAKLATVPCHIRSANDDETEMLKIHENLYRENISPAEEAKHFDYLVKKKQLTPTRISQLINKSLSYVTERMAILAYPQFLLDAMNNGEISFSVAKEFSKFDDEKQMLSAVYYAKRGGMTQEMARKWVTDYKRDKERPQIESQSSVNPETGTQVIEHLATCIFCNTQLKLYDAEVVYMHSECRMQAEAVHLPETTTQS